MIVLCIAIGCVCWVCVRKRSAFLREVVSVKECVCWRDTFSGGMLSLNTLTKRIRLIEGSGEVETGLP